MIAAFRRWKERRYWQKRHLEALRQMLDEDYRWLVEDPVGRAIVERHQRMARSSWHQADHEPVPQFRERMRRLAAEALKAKQPPTEEQPEALAERFNQALIDYSSDQLQRLSSSLRDLLVDDHLTGSERQLLGTAEVIASCLAKNERLTSEAAKSERRAIAFGDVIQSHVIAMRAAVVAAANESPDRGIEWIQNTLRGPGHLPNIDTETSAQALWDRETAEHEKFRAAHPAPVIPS